MPRTYSDIKSYTPKNLAIELKASMLAFKSLCTKQARQIQRKLKKKHFSDNISEGIMDTLKGKVPMSSCIFKKKAHVKASQKEAKDECVGVWQKRILMGTKCQPMDFSGAIYYDINGKQVNKGDGQE